MNLLHLGRLEPLAGHAVRLVAGLALSCLAINVGVAWASEGSAKQGGSTNVQNTNSGGSAGFNCAPGTAWTNDGGVARCSIPAAPSTPMAPCAAVVNYTGVGVCRFDLPAVGHGVTVSAPNKLVTHIGQVSVTCNNGAWGVPTGSCIPKPTIAVSAGAGPIVVGETYSWSWSTTDATSTSFACTGANPTSGTLGTSGSRSVGAVSPGVTSCSMTATGPGGTTAPYEWSWTARLPYDCSATSFAQGACSYSIPWSASGGVVGGSNVSPGYSGTVTASCYDGVFSFGAASCDPLPPVDCAAATHSSGACSFNVPAILNGGNATVSTFTPGHTGSVTASCSNGSLSFGGASCAPLPPTGCSASTRTVGSCSFDVPPLTSGASASPSNTTPGFTGSLTATCTNGSVAFTNEICNALPPSDCGATSHRVGACVYAVPAIANGNSQAAGNITPGHSGSVTASCSGGSLSFAGATCVVDEPNSCASSTQTYGSCSFNIPGLSSGGSATVTNTVPGFTGSMTGTCSNGSLSLSGASCAPTVSPPVESCNANSLGDWGVEQGDYHGENSGRWESVTQLYKEYEVYIPSLGRWVSGACFDQTQMGLRVAIIGGGGDGCDGWDLVQMNGVGGGRIHENGFTEGDAYSSTLVNWTRSCQARGTYTRTCGARPFVDNDGALFEVPSFSHGTQTAPLSTVADGYSRGAVFTCTDGDISLGSPTGPGLTRMPRDVVLSNDVDPMFSGVPGNVTAWSVGFGRLFNGGAVNSVRARLGTNSIDVLLNMTTQQVYDAGKPQFDAYVASGTMPASFTVSRTVFLPSEGVTATVTSVWRFYLTEWGYYPQVSYTISFS